MSDPHPKYFQDYEYTASVLLPYGWFITPYMTGEEVSKTKRLCEKIEKGIYKNVSDITSNINCLLEPVVFHPNLRAFYIHRASELPHVSDFSHFIERAIFHYYKRDYISCILCLLPSMEGVLLNHYGWSFSANSPRKPTIDKMLKRLSQTKISSCFNDRYQLYLKTLHDFIAEWIYKDTSLARFDVSLLNRHYILHGMGTNAFYDKPNCNRLILFFDLYIELLSLEYGNCKYCLIPTNITNLNKRRNYYCVMMSNRISSINRMIYEEYLLRDHKKYRSNDNFIRGDMIERSEDSIGVASLDLGIALWDPWRK